MSTPTTTTLDLNIIIVQLFNTQIALEYKAYFEYKQIATILGSQSVALPGLRKLFLRKSEEELSQADVFIDKLNRRGHDFAYRNCTINSNEVISEISQLDLANLGPGLAGFVNTAIDIEKSVYDGLAYLKIMTDEELREWDVS